MEKIEDIIRTPIQLTETLRALAANEVEDDSYKYEFKEVTLRAEAIAQLLCTVARGCNFVVDDDDSSDGSNQIYMRPLCRIMKELNKSLGKSIILIRKCHHKCAMKRFITIIPVYKDFKKVCRLLDNSKGDITWLINICGFGGVGGNKVDLHGLPPITSWQPMVGLCWEQMMHLERGNDIQKEDAVNSLGLLARDNDKFARIILEEGAVVPMLKVLAHGTPKAREAAARGLEYMAKDVVSVNQMVNDGVVPAFINVLTRAPMKVQTAVASALAVMLTINPEHQDTFVEHLVLPPLIALLGESFEELNEKNATDSERYIESSEVQVELKAQVAGALFALARGNFNISKSISETNALLWFATYMETGKGALRLNSALAVMEIAAILAEKHVELKWSGFDSNSPSAKAAVEQVLSVVECSSPAFGCLARSFPACESTVLKSLVKRP